MKNILDEIRKTTGVAACRTRESHQRNASRSWLLDIRKESSTARQAWKKRGKRESDLIAGEVTKLLGSEPMLFEYSWPLPLSYGLAFENVLHVNVLLSTICMRL